LRRRREATLSAGALLEMGFTDVSVIQAHLQHFALTHMY